jgi:hypothetical protein
MALDLEALKAQFAAKGGSVTRVPAGAQSLSKQELRAVSGYERDSVAKWYCLAMGEDGKEWADYVYAETRTLAEAKFRKAYPEARIEALKRA